MKFIVSRLSQLLLAILATAPLATHSNSIAKAEAEDLYATLTIEVVGLLTSKGGEVCIRLFNQETGFPYGPQGLYLQSCDPVTAETQILEFSGVDFGTYAIALVHDTNGNQKLDKNFFGIPKEGFGFSNNPTVSAKTREPNFERAGFAIEQPSTNVRISVKYDLDPS